MKKLLIAMVLLQGCAVKAQFVPSTEITNREQTDYTKLEVYYSESKVPYAYTELGRIFLEGKMSAQQQLYKIRDRAAFYGATAVIILSQAESQASGSSYKNVASFDSSTAQRYTGIAIIKK